MLHRQHPGGPLVEGQVLRLVPALDALVAGQVRVIIPDQRRGGRLVVPALVEEGADDALHGITQVGDVDERARGLGQAARVVRVQLGPVEVQRPARRVAPAQREVDRCASGLAHVQEFDARSALPQAAPVAGPARRRLEQRRAAFRQQLFLGVQWRALQLIEALAAAVGPMIEDGEQQAACQQQWDGGPGRRGHHASKQLPPWEDWGRRCWPWRRDRRRARPPSTCFHRSVCILVGGLIGCVGEVRGWDGATFAMMLLWVDSVTDDGSREGVCVHQKSGGSGDGGIHSQAGVCDRFRIDIEIEFDRRRGCLGPISSWISTDSLHVSIIEKRSQFESRFERAQEEGPRLMNSRRHVQSVASNGCVMDPTDRFQVQSFENGLQGGQMRGHLRCRRGLEAVGPVRPAEWAVRSCAVRRCT